MDSNLFFYQPLVHQATLNGIVSFSGKAGFFADDASLELRPAEPDTGLVIVWRGGRFQALIDYLLPSHLRTTALAPQPQDTLDSPPAIYTVEHLLSAIYGLGVTNCEIHIADNGMIPFGDGSAYEFCNKVLEIGIDPQEKHYRRALYCQKKIRVDQGDAFIEINPPTARALKISAHIDFPEPIGEQSLSYFHSPLSYCLNVAWARTFATRDFESEEITKKSLPAFNLIPKWGGSHIDSPMLVFKAKQFITSVRRIDEHVRHKVLDFIGDIALLGFDLYGDVYLHKSGHALNWKFVKELQSHLRSNAISVAVEPGGPAQPKYEGDKSRYVKDVTLIDGASYLPKEKLVKTWEITNVGTVPWIGRVLKRIGPCSGYGIVASQPMTRIPDTSPGNIVEISVEIETPELQGWYLAEWKMIDSEGDYVFPNRYPLSIVLRVG